MNKEEFIEAVKKNWQLIIDAPAEFKNDKESSRQEPNKLL
jgi:hypothetical protein